MPYTAEITRKNPTCVLFMIDQSRSMRDEVSAGDRTAPKSAGVASTINRWLQELSLKCAKGDGVRDYYHVGVIGYGKKVGPALVGPTAGKDLVPISEIAGNPGRIEERKQQVPDEKGKLRKQAVKVPIWFDPVADGGTPMCQASAEAYRVLEGWLGKHGGSYPPLVIHITDGEATDGDPEQRVRALTNLSTSDGNTTLFNIHLSAHKNATPVIFPDSPDNLPDEYSRMLFNTASPLTEAMRAVAKERGIPTTAGSRAFVLNADLVALVQAIEIGTRPSNVAMDEPAVSPAGGMLSDTEADAAAAREMARAGKGAGASDPTAAPAASGKTTVRLSIMETGKIVEANIELDKKGKIVGVVPALPIDPNVEYRLGPAN
jgi:hypothetical protein